MDLIMPSKNREITLKIISCPYVAGNDAYCDVTLFGNPNNWTYRMKLGKTLWFSILKHLQELDGFRTSEELEPSVIEDNLEYLKGRIITIRAISDTNVSFKTKDGKEEYGKKFIAEFRSDLEEAQSIGGEIYKKAVGDAVYKFTCEECIVVNSNLAKAEIEKQKEKELAAEERRKRSWEESTEDWVVRKREEDKKKAEINKKRGDCAGW